MLIPTYNLIEYSNAYLKTSTSLWQYSRDEPDLENIMVILMIFLNSALFKLKQQITGQIGNGGTRDVCINISKCFLESTWNALN